jgi:hypothetical protein
MVAVLWMIQMKKATKLVAILLTSVLIFASCVFVNYDVKTTAQITEINRENKNITVSFADDYGEIHTAVINCGINISEIVSGQTSTEIKFNSQNPNDAILYTNAIGNYEKHLILILALVLIAFVSAALFYYEFICWN